MLSFWGNRKWSTVIFLALIVLAIAILTWHLPLIGDDYGYTFIIDKGCDSDYKIKNLSDLLVSQYNHLLTVNGRLFVHVVFQCIDAFIGKWFFNLLNPLFFLAYVLLTAYYAVGKVSFPIIVVTVALIVLMPSFKDLYLWMAGSMNYLWVTVIVLIFLIQLDRREDRLIDWSSWKILLLSFVAGCSHEGISVPIAVGLLAVALPSYRKIRHTERFWMLVTFAVGAFICAMFNIHRANSNGEELQKLIDDRLFIGTTILSSLHLLYLLMILTVLFLFIKRTIVLSVLRKNVSWLIAIIITVPIVLGAGVWQERAAYTIEYASIILILKLLYEMKVKGVFSLSPRSILYSSWGLGVIILLFFSCILYWSELNRQQFRYMEDQILEGNQLVYYDDFKVPRLFSPYIMENISGVKALDPDNHLCRVIAKYYNVKSLAFFPLQLLDDMDDNTITFDDFTDCGHLPFYAKRKKDKEEIENVRFLYRAATNEEKPWWVRFTGIRREDDGEIFYDAVYSVVNIDDEEWIFVQKYEDMNSRLDYIEITYKGDKAHYYYFASLFQTRQLK